MLFSFLNKPYPYTGKVKNDIWINFLIGCFIAFFLIVFQPFHIAEWNTSYKTLKLLGFGLVSFIIPLLVSFGISVIIQRKTLEDRWRIWSEVAAIITVLCFIALGNMIYAGLLGAVPLTINNFPGALLSVLSIGIFPVTLHVILKHNKLLKINYEKALAINSHLSHQLSSSVNLNETPLISPLTLIADNGKDKLVLNPDQLFYIESADNYSNVIFMDGTLQKKHLIRSSLKRLESQLTSPQIIRCHRTFIVNLKNIKKIEGNAAGYRLSFPQIQDSIPVSRTYAPILLQKLNGN
ncbi:MAG: LytTR family transcriptional regulator [Bacteroidetes bacterium]|nr:LytTR family transcriptional regulator [Bacteroidota bacterium]